jgi:hypothetical protein
MTAVARTQPTSWSDDVSTYILISAHPEMANLPDICVARKTLSWEYQSDAPQRHFLRAPPVKSFERLDLEPIFLFLDGHHLNVIVRFKLSTYGVYAMRVSLVISFNGITKRERRNGPDDIKSNAMD